MLPSETQVLIVGAGPTGLALAATLQKGGVDHLVVDALDGAQNTSRAAVIHAHTLEKLQAIDVIPSMEAQALQVSHFTVRDRGEALLDLTFDQLPSAFQHLLMIPQSSTEALLESRLREMGGAVHRGVAALGATADLEGAQVRVATSDGEQIVHARFVVAADGMHSVVREAAGIGFAGDTSGESFILADVRMDWPFGTREVSMFFSPAGPVVIAPLPDGSFRVVATLDDAPEQLTVSDIQKVLDARGPMTKVQVTGIGWASRFRVHHRLAEAYRRGPFLLMGDAAHVHSPAGGQGMNTGLVDAMVLGEALIRVVRDGESDTLLDDYARTRRPAAADVLALASRLTRVATVHSVMLRRIRNLVLRMFDHMPAFKYKLALGFSGIGRAQYSVLPRSASIVAFQSG